MADLTPMPGVGFTAGVVTGQTAPVDIPARARTVSATCAVLSGEIQLSLQMLYGGIAEGNWTNVITLPAQSGAGVEQASAQVPANATNKMRLAWTGAATITAFATAV